MSRLTSRSRLFMSIAIGLALLLMAGTVVLAITTTKTGGAVKGVKVVTVDLLYQIVSQAPTDISGMSLSMTVPSRGEGAAADHLLGADDLQRA